MSDAEAWQNYQRTGKHLGIFEKPEHADAYAETLHNDYAAGKIPGYKPPTGDTWMGITHGYDVPAANLPPLNRRQ